MKYIDICTSDNYVDRMEDIAKARTAKIPLLYVRNETEYWISEKGDMAFVVHEICERKFIDLIKIHTEKKSPNSEKYIKYRTNRGTQSAITVSRAVYGAFVLKDTIPKHLPRHKDLCPWNCSLENLELPEEINGRLKTNLYKYLDDYRECFKNFVDYCQAITLKSRQDAEDIVEDAFIATCERGAKIKDFRRVWITSIKKRFCFRQYTHHHEPLENIEDTIIPQIETKYTR